MTQPTASESWLYAVLSGDADLALLVGDRIFDGVGRPDAAYPFVVFQFQGGHDVAGVSAIRLMSQELYLVKAVGRGASYAALKPIAKRIDELLHRQRGVTADGTVWSCVREQPFKNVYIEDRIQHRQLGGLYRTYPAA